MSVIDLETGPSTTVSSIHLIPCCIDYNGPANVNKYFHSSCKEKSDNKDGVMTASIRGRPLLGKCLDIPKGCKGVVIKEKVAVCSDHQQRTAVIDKDFQQLTYWNLETTPTADDTIMKAFDWFEIANVLHAPVKKEGENLLSTPPDP